MSPPSFTEFETLEVAIKERCRVLAGGLCETQRSRESFRTRRSAASSGSTCLTLRVHRGREALDLEAVSVLHWALLAFSTDAERFLSLYSKLLSLEL